MPAPTIAISTTRNLCERHGDLEAQLLAGAAEVDLARRAVRRPALLPHPAVHGFVGAEDLGEVALGAADLRERDLAARKALVAVAPGHAHLDRPVLVLVHGAVVEHERG